jgi:hypothetical protein
MSTLLTRTTRAASTAAVLAGVVLGLATPAAMPTGAAPIGTRAAAVAPVAAGPTTAAPAPAGETRETCAAPVEGVQLCEVYTGLVTGQSSGDVHAELRTAAGVRIQAALLTADACSASCNSLRTAAGQDVADLRTADLPVGKGTGYYRVTGTWVVGNHQHTGVV